MDILDRRLLYASQVFSGAVLAISVVGLFSEGIHVLGLLLRVLGSITVIMFYIVFVFSVESGGGYIERVGRPFIIAAIILALFSLLSFLLAPEPDLYGVEAVRVFGYNFLVFLIISMILSWLEDVKCR